MDDLQSKLFHRGRKPVAQPAAVPAAVPLNIADRGWAYVVRAALPGVKQDDVKVAISGHTLTIRSCNGHDGDRISDDEWIVQEHSPKDWERSLDLPHEVDGSAVSAEYRDGILELCLPKADPETSRPIPIMSGERT
jgi:HSP20 family protein